MKNRLVWYVDSTADPKGRQSNHVATVVILAFRTLITGEPYFRVGVTVKHSKDKMPFVKRAGRELATERAKMAPPVFSISEAALQAWNGIRAMPNDESVDMNRLLANIQHVLSRVVTQ